MLKRFHIRQDDSALCLFYVEETMTKSLYGAVRSGHNYSLRLLLAQVNDVHE